MASVTAFQPFGISTQIPVGSTAVTTSVSIINGTVTAALSGGNYPPQAVRIANEGTASVYIMFHATTGVTASVSTSIGMKMLSNSVETFNVRGTPVIVAICASTFTTTLTVSPGEGM
jgi:hypothetical protein